MQYVIKTTADQREIIEVALKNQKKLAQDLFSLVKRLGKPDTLANEAMGEVEYLTQSFTAMNIGERDAKDWEINHAGAEQLRASLVNFQRQATKQDGSAHQLTLLTDLGKKTKMVQDIFDQVSEQLKLDLVPIDSAVDAMDAKPKAEESASADDATREGSPLSAGKPSTAASRPLALVGAKTKTGRAGHKKAAKKK